MDNYITHIIVLPDGTVLISPPTEEAAERWHMALFGRWQSRDGHQTIIAPQSGEIVVTDLRR